MLNVTLDRAKCNLLSVNLAIARNELIEAIGQAENMLEVFKEDIRTQYETCKNFIRGQAFGGLKDWYIRLEFMQGKTFTSWK